VGGGGGAERPDVAAGGGQWAIACRGLDEDGRDRKPARLANGCGKGGCAEDNLSI
jgi:hypothetical protein